MTRRTDRVAELLRTELNELILHRVKDPRVKLATVTGVEVTGDLSRAKVLVSVLGEDEARDSAMEGLLNARGYLRTQLSRRLRLRTTPELIFELDRGAEHSQRINDLLEELDVRPESS